VQDPAVTVHLAVLDLSAPVAPGDLAWLDDEEQARLTGFGSPTAARRFAASHAFLRRVLAARLGVAPSAVTYERSCEHCGHPGHGRPRLAGGPPGVEFSLSHSGRLAVVAVGPGPLGADVEDLARRPVAPGMVRRVTTGAERSRLPATGSPGRHRAVLELWTAKEAVAKALGLGVVLPFASFEVAPGHPVAADPAGGAPLAVTPVAVPGAVASVAAPVGARVEAPSTQPAGEPAVEG
jgi:4'-phosphopantetheinyl transferase